MILHLLLNNMQIRIWHDPSVTLHSPDRFVPEDPDVGYLLRMHIEFTKGSVNYGLNYQTGFILRSSLSSLNLRLLSLRHAAGVS